MNKQFLPHLILLLTIAFVLSACGVKKQPAPLYSLPQVEDTKKPTPSPAASPTPSSKRTNS